MVTTAEEAKRRVRWLPELQGGTMPVLISYFTNWTAATLLTFDDQVEDVCGRVKQRSTGGQAITKMHSVRTGRATATTALVELCHFGSTSSEQDRLLQVSVSLISSHRIAGESMRGIRYGLSFHVSTVEVCSTSSSNPPCQGASIGCPSATLIQGRPNVRE